MLISSPQESLFLRPTQQLDAPPGAIEFHAMQEARLLAYFLDFSTEERLARFRYAVSDDSIRRWRARLDWNWYCAVGCEDNGRLWGLAELFGAPSTGWKQAELVLSLRNGASEQERTRLVRAALHAARTRGASAVSLLWDGPDILASLLSRDCRAELDRGTGMPTTPLTPAPSR